MKTVNSDQKQYRLQKHKQLKREQKTKLGKTTLWAFQTTNKKNLTGENLDITKTGKLLESNWISSDSNTKQHHKD